MSRFDTVLFGTLCGLLAAVGYTAANICLRSVAEVDPIWVSAMKSVPNITLVGPWLIYLTLRGRPVAATPAALVALACAALVGQVGGNVSFQWALGQIGIALTVPLTLGTMIVGGALCGRLVLHEPVSVRSGVGMAVLILAIVLLSLGAGQAHEAVAKSLHATDLSAHSTWRVVAAVAAAAGAGLAYAILGVAIRYGVTGRATLPVVMFVTGLMGLIPLGSLTLWRIGLVGIAHTTPTNLAWMLGAGVCNVIAFWALTNSLRLTSVVYVNALNASQATMAAIAGAAFFHESLTWQLIGGVALTAAGLMVMRKHEEHRRAHAATIAAAMQPGEGSSG